MGNMGEQDITLQEISYWRSVEHKKYNKCIALATYETFKATEGIVVKTQSHRKAGLMAAVAHVFINMSFGLSSQDCV